MVKSQVIEGISGLRGYGPEFMNRLEQFTVAYAAFYKDKGMNRVVFGRDTRPGEIKVLETVKEIYLGCGYNFIDLGITPTPTVQLIAKELGILGNEGTASHNPNPWIGLKPFTSEGIIPASDLEAIQRIACSTRPAYDGNMGRTVGIDSIIDLSIAQITGNKALDYHISKVLDVFGKQIVDAIRQKRYKVVVDHVMGAGYVIVPELLKHLGCDVIQVDEGEPMTHFPREEPEPTPKNLSGFAELLIQENADIGFAVDPDVDRLVLGSTQGCLSEEYTLAIAIKYFTERYEPGTAVVNLSTSRMGEEIARENGWQFIRTPVGERNVLDGILSNRAVIGGEGNGGIIYPGLAPGRDAIYGMVLTLAYMAETSQSLASIVKGIPKYHMTKDKFILKDGIDFNNVLTQVRDLVVLKSIGGLIGEDSRDGLRLDFENGWVHLRKSNTEPIIRVIAEARTEEDVENLVTRIRSLFE